MFFKQIILILLFVGSCHLQTGAKVQVSQKGLNYVGTIGVSLLEKEVNTISIADSDNIYNIKITSFTKPSSNIVINPNAGLSISLNNAAIAVDFNWRYKIGKGWFSIRDSGSGNARSTSINISISLNMGVDAQGKPTVQFAECSSILGGFKVSSGNWIYDLLIKASTALFNIDIPRRLEQEMCNAVQKLVSSSLAPKLATINTDIKIDEQIKLSYALTEKPAFQSQFIQTSHIGLFYTDNIKYISPNSPIMTMSAGTKMVNLALSESLFNSAGLVFQKLGRLDRTETIVNSQVNTILGLPAGPLTVQLSTTTPPFIIISPSSFIINASTTVRLSAGSNQIFSADMSMRLVCDVYLQANRISGRVDSISASFANVQTSKPDELPADFLQKVINGLLEKIKPALNIKGAEGFPLPQLENVNLVGPVIQRYQGYLVIATDLN